MLDELLANQLRQARRRHLKSRPLRPWQPSVRRRGEHFETFMLILMGIALFATCAALAFGTVAAARSASKDISFPIVRAIPAAPGPTARFH